MLSFFFLLLLHSVPLQIPTVVSLTCKYFCLPFFRQATFQFPFAYCFAYKRSYKVM
jgi:hypothetical protein